MTKDNSDFVSKKARRESQVKAAVKLLMAKHNWFWDMPAANVYGASGRSDFFGAKWSVFMWIETKSNGGKPTANQLKFLRAIRDAGGFAFVVDEARLGVFEEFLQRFDRSAYDVANRKALMNEDGARMLDCIAAMTRELA